MLVKMMIREMVIIKLMVMVKAVLAMKVLQSRHSQAKMRSLVSVLEASLGVGHSFPHDHDHDHDSVPLWWSSSWTLVQRRIPQRTSRMLRRTLTRGGSS